MIDSPLAAASAPEPRCLKSKGEPLDAMSVIKSSERLKTLGRTRLAGENYQLTISKSGATVFGAMKNPLMRARRA
jgi:hypothetical protein